MTCRIGHAGSRSSCACAVVHLLVHVEGYAASCELNKGLKSLNTRLKSSHSVPASFLTEMALPMEWAKASQHKRC